MRKVIPALFFCFIIVSSFGQEYNIGHRQQPGLIQQETTARLN